MSEILFDGSLVLRWLKSDKAELSLIVGCDLDDDVSGELVTVAGVDRERQVVIGERGQRMPFARLGKCQLIASPDHPVVPAIKACVSPLDRRDEDLRKVLGPMFPSSIAASDLPAIHAAELSRRENRLLDKDQRYRAFRALQHNKLHLHGLEIVQVWRAEAQARGLPWADIAFQLATFLRDGFHAAKAAAAQEALDDPRAGASPAERARLATVQAGALIEKFTRRGGEQADLIAAWNAIGLAWAIEKERDHPEVRAVYRKLETFGPDPR
ncbi:hypothetical protein [Caulobacter endophyticus]|uniref:Uncharacterized protein n=1 Tax=Caulobacter endophyticus TaxID=2172652 RepID=A0A2T9K286_9CAUL|nr:hypothetical protein [Caulobacter endophyticus]PVM90077.1 hypothetical protein DDF67_10735 [Caulobacter endophyticus]